MKPLRTKTRTERSPDNGWQYQDPAYLALSGDNVYIFRKGRERRTGLFASCFPCSFQSVYTTSLIRNLP